MSLKNSFYLFLLPFWLFLFRTDKALFYQTNEDNFSIPKIKWQEKGNNIYMVKKTTLEQLDPLDTFFIEKEDGIYYFKVLKKYYQKIEKNFLVDESKIVFYTNLNTNLQLVVIAINTGKLTEI